MLREVLVVKRSVLFKEGSFEGFIPVEEKDFYKIIMENFEYRERADMEVDENYKQVVSYVWLINPETKKVFLYQRSPSGYEKRLHNRYSGGIGGHIDKDTEENSEKPIETAMIRELHEELFMQKYPEPKVVGWISDDSNPVGKVHLGSVAIAETIEDAKPAEDMEFGKFLSIEEIENLFSNPENSFDPWTKLSWSFIKSYLAKLN
jgi:predicted NUDIX family phosphoesterase